MKKITEQVCSYYDLFGKILLIMRNAVIILLISAFHAAALSGYSQTTQLSLKMKGASIREVLTEIENQSDFYFFYNNELIDVNRKLDISVKDKKIDEILSQLFNKNEVEFIISDRYIVLKPSTGDATQQTSVSGKVTDENGEPLPGVTVVIKGTNQGTVTNNQGEYSLNNISENTTLVFSFVGMKTLEIPVNGKNLIDAQLSVMAIGIEEVVAVGYGSMKKRDVVGSVSTIDNTMLDRNKSSVNFVDALQGQAAGLSVQSNSGVPGSGAQIKIRGLNTLHAGSGDPLWIVDGIPVKNYTGAENYGTQAQSPMALINPNDIESIQILKDAGATAIYGSRGSNGIILITTKSGKGSKTGINVNLSSGISELSRTPQDIGYMNTAEWFSVMDVASGNEGTGEYQPQFTYNRNPYAYDRLTRDEALTVNTNWFDEILETGSYKEVNVSSVKSFEGGNVFLSGNYRNDNSVIRFNDMDRYSLRSNISFDATKNLKLGANISLSHTANNRMKNSGKAGGDGNMSGNTGGFAVAGYSAMPWSPVYNEDGTYHNPLASNPVAVADPANRKDFLTTYRALGAISGEYTVPFIKGLSIRSEGSFDILQTNQTNWVNAIIRETGSLAREEAIMLKTFNLNAYATYDRSWEKHALTLLAGTEGQRDGGYARRMEAGGIQGTYQEMGEPTEFKYMLGAMTDERYLLSYFSRINYKFNERYILGLSARSDGASKFPENERWGTFIAYSAGWILSEEGFMSSLAEQGTFLKLRGSFGQTGNEAVPSYLFVQTYYTGLSYGDQSIGGLGGILPSNIVSGLTWEKTSSVDVGFDFGFFKNRISGSVAYYYKKVDNLLLETPLPLSTGIGGDAYNYWTNRSWGNIGRLDNSGFELEFTSINFNTKNFTWKTSFNFGTNNNELIRLDNEGNNVIGREYSINRVGGKINEWYMARFYDVDPAIGVERIVALDQEHYELTGETISLKNEDGSDVLLYASKTTIQQNFFIHEGKSSTPTFYGGLTNNFNYRGFDFSFFISFSGGNYIFDYDEQTTSTVRAGGVLRTALLDNYWEKEGDVVKFPSPRYNQPFVVDGKNYELSREWTAYDKYLHKGDYARLKNIQLGYRLPSSFLTKLHLQEFRINISATNLFTLTDYNGWDPEGATLVYEAVVPQLKTYSLGLDFKF